MQATFAILYVRQPVVVGEAVAERQPVVVGEAVVVVGEAVAVVVVEAVLVVVEVVFAEQHGVARTPYSVVAGPVPRRYVFGRAAAGIVVLVEVSVETPRCVGKSAEYTVVETCCAGPPKSGVVFHGFSHVSGRALAFFEGSPPWPKFVGNKVSSEFVGRKRRFSPIIGTVN